MFSFVAERMCHFVRLCSSQASAVTPPASCSFAASQGGAVPGAFLHQVQLNHCFSLVLRLNHFCLQDLSCHLTFCVVSVHLFLSTAIEGVGCWVLRLNLTFSSLDNAGETGAPPRVVFLCFTLQVWFCQWVECMARDSFRTWEEGLVFQSFQPLKIKPAR